jgi:excisionase family DNA binding protein
MMEDYFTPKEAAEALGIRYPTLIARIRAGKIKAIKKGWALFIHKSEIEKAKHANTKDLATTSR